MDGASPGVLAFLGYGRDFEDLANPSILRKDLHNLRQAMRVEVAWHLTNAECLRMPPPVGDEPGRAIIRHYKAIRQVSTARFKISTTGLAIPHSAEGGIVARKVSSESA
ncbi:hypothetical protein V502_02903 [Pseudogymnoascus sp. VKM F-4520 (FW-2644)]|nr:hypothetical protein V502_02903 [Pseudogymnoascus sp. VKM F-4520 (FW-2644)]